MPRDTNEINEGAAGPRPDDEKGAACPRDAVAEERCRDGNSLLATHTHTHTLTHTHTHTHLHTHTYTHLHTHTHTTARL